MLECLKLVKRYGALEVTRDVSIRLEPGERHAVIGPNGAGKTTLFNLLSGDVRPDSGAVLIGGEDVTRLSPDQRARRGLARSFQRNSSFPGLTVAENLTVAATLAAGRGWTMLRPLARFTDLKRNVEAHAHAVGVTQWLETPVGALSYGVQRQVEIGMALAGEPTVLMLDEPTAGMSHEETGLVQRLILGLPRSLTVLVIEHDMDVVFSVADRITVLDRGEVIACGRPESIRDSRLVQERYLGGLAP